MFVLKAETHSPGYLGCMKASITCALPLLLAVTIGAATPSFAQTAPTATIQLTVADQPAISLSAASLAQAPRLIVQATDHKGKPHRYEGVALHYLLAGAGVKLECRGDAIAQVVTVTSRDGYRAVLAIGEVIPDLAPQVILLADRCDGQPLLAATGPWQLIVPGDRKPTRWVRQVESVRVGMVPVENRK